MTEYKIIKMDTYTYIYIDLSLQTRKTDASVSSTRITHRLFTTSTHWSYHRTSIHQNHLTKFYLICEIIPTNRFIFAHITVYNSKWQTEEVEKNRWLLFQKWILLLFIWNQLVLNLNTEVSAAIKLRWALFVPNFTSTFTYQSVMLANKDAPRGSFFFFRKRLTLN